MPPINNDEDLTNTPFEIFMQCVIYIVTAIVTFVPLILIVNAMQGGAN